MERLNQTFGNILLGSEKSFPNIYWGLKSREFICSKCEFILMCHHIALIPLHEDHILREALFINTPLFVLTIDLNEFAETILREQKKYSIAKLIGSSLIQWAIKRRTILGTWSLMNIEVIVKKRIQTAPKKFVNIIDYFDLPYHITRILLDYEIASLIKRINEEKIFDLIVSGKFSELEKANYFVLRGILKLKNNENIPDNDPLRKYISDVKQENLNKISQLLPELYAKILKVLGQTKGGKI
jgi:CRISPR-associated protein Cst1